MATDHTPDNQPADYEASGATALTAAVLSALGGLVIFLVTVRALSTMASSVPQMGMSPSVVLAGAYFLVQLAIAITLMVGGGLLMRRKPHGRIIVATGCVASIVLHLGFLILVFLATYALTQSMGPGAASSYAGMDFTRDVVTSWLNLVFAIVTAALALAPSTRRWVSSRPD
jgi:hypothetical protein